MITVIGRPGPRSTALLTSSATTAARSRRISSARISKRCRIASLARAGALVVGVSTKQNSPSSGSFIFDSIPRALSEQIGASIPFRTASAGEPRQELPNFDEPGFTKPLRNHGGVMPALQLRQLTKRYDD